MKKVKAKIGEYEKDGQTRSRYTDVGVIGQSHNGEYMLIDATVNFAAILYLQNMMNEAKGKKPSDRVMVSIFDDSNRQQPSQQRQQDVPPMPPGLDGDEIPF